jgi:predicted nucleic acid-binding protein
MKVVLDTNVLVSGKMTGNKKHFPQNAAGAVPVTSPRAFLDMLRVR